MSNSMMMRRRVMGHDVPAYIYRIDNVPTTQTDTGIKLGDTNKAFTILSEMSFPTTYINDRNTWIGIGNNVVYSDGTFSTSAQNAAVFLTGGNNFFRIRFFDGGAYHYASAADFPYLSNDRRHRFAHWHEANSATSTIDLDGYGEIVTANGTYAASNNTLIVKSTEDKIIVHSLYIYDKVLTAQEISGYISTGIIP